ncbi:hypothetical protein JCM8547_008749 [Rhodosporidiobolus lusitaniae]
MALYNDLSYNDYVDTGSITALWKVKGLREFLEEELEGDRVIEAPVRSPDRPMSNNADEPSERSRPVSTEEGGKRSFAPDVVSATGYAVEKGYEYGTGRWAREGEHAVSIQALYSSTKLAGLQFFTEPRQWGGVGGCKSIRTGEFLLKSELLADPLVGTRYDVTMHEPKPAAPSSPPAAPSSASVALFKAYEGFFDDPSASAVTFSFTDDSRNGIDRRLYANKEFLAARSSYFRTMFESGFMESSLAPSANSPRRRENGEKKTATASDDDDDVWLPEEWLEVSSAVAKAGADEEDGVKVEVKQEEQDNRRVDGETGRQNIEIVDTGYTTYHAMLSYLYTTRISFHTILSNFIVYLFDPSTSSSTPYASRRSFLVGPNDPEDLASPHAVYRLADKLGMEELKD